MAIYRFPATVINGIISHVVAYDATILSMTPEQEQYVMELDIPISQEELVHLNEEYGLVEVV